MSVFDLLSKDEDESKGDLKGVAIGVVTNLDDPKKLGRIKVRLHWRENEDDTYWARVATLMAGPDRGSFFLPEPGDEVLVAFERDDIRHPFIIGALWNGQDKPPEPDYTEENNIRKIKTRAGHEIIFDDDKNDSSRKVEIHTEKGHKIVLDDASGSEKIEIIDKTGSNKIVIDSVQNNMNIECGASLTIKATQITIEASATMTLKANSALTIQGQPVAIN